MSSRSSLTDRELTEVSRSLLSPYTIPDSCPYLSEDQRELSKLTLAERSAWMAEWLLWADEPDPPEPEPADSLLAPGTDTAKPMPRPPKDRG